MPEAERPILFSNMIYIGDGGTDIPCMKIVKYQGGHAVAVYDRHRRKTAKKPSPKGLCLKLLEQQRADFVLPADYRDGKDLDKLAKAIIDKIQAQSLITVLGK